MNSKRPRKRKKTVQPKVLKTKTTSGKKRCNQKSKRCYAVAVKQTLPWSFGLKKSLLKITTFCLIVGLNWAGLSAIGQTFAYYSDAEGSTNNLLQAATLDFVLTSPNDFLPEYISTGNPSSREITIVNDGSLDFNYNVKAEKTAGDDDFCNALLLEAKIGDLVQYTGPLFNFISPTTTFPTTTPTWSYNLTLTPDTEFDGDEICQFKFIYDGWQQNLATGQGFHDTEEISNIIKAPVICLPFSAGYWAHHEGCDQNPAVSNWTTQINDLSLTQLQGAFATTTGAEICTLLDVTNCPSGGTKAGKLCRAKRQALADLSNIVSLRLDLNALIAGADNGSLAFDTLGLGPLSTIKMALVAVETIIKDPASTSSQLGYAAYVAERIYTFYEKENSKEPACIYPGCGNGIVETGEECDDGNSTPNDGCSNQCTTGPACEMSLTIQDLPDPVTPGGILNYHLTLTNTGTVMCTGSGVELKEFYDSHTTFVSSSLKPSNSNNLWNFGEVPPGQVNEVTVNLLVSPEVLAGETLVNKVCFWTLEYDKWVCVTENTEVTATAAEPTVVMNEFLPNPDGEEYGFNFGQDGDSMPQGEWVELYNNDDFDRDLTGWRIQDVGNHLIYVTAANTDLATTTIAAHGWLVVYMNHQVLNNSGTETIALIDNNQNLKDVYTYSGGDYCDLEPTPGDDNDSVPTGSCSGVSGNKSFARIPDGIGNWVDPIPTPGGPNLLASQDLIFSPMVESPADDSELLTELPVSQEMTQNPEPDATLPTTEDPAVATELPLPVSSSDSESNLTPTEVTETAEETADNEPAISTEPTVSEADSSESTGGDSLPTETTVVDNSQNSSTESQTDNTSNTSDSPTIAAEQPPAIEPTATPAPAVEISGSDNSGANS